VFQAGPWRDYLTQPCAIRIDHVDGFELPFLAIAGDASKGYPSPVRGEYWLDVQCVVGELLRFGSVGAHQPNGDAECRLVERNRVIDD
jgi:hypothetical protein